MKSADNRRHPSELEIQRAVEAIRSGLVVAVPTETFYGLAADPENESALLALFALKQRPKDNPILLLISRLEQLQRYVADIPGQYRPLMKAHWPGPLTLVFPAKTGVSTLLTGGTGSIGIRLTPHPVACAIIEQLGRPITATSANLSGHAPARTARQARDFFGEGLGGLVDDGPADGGPPSTVVNLVDGVLCIEREGRVRLPGVPRCG